MLHSELASKRRHFCFAIIHQSINELLFFYVVAVKSSSRAARKVRVLRPRQRRSSKKIPKQTFQNETVFHNVYMKIYRRSCSTIFKRFLWKNQLEKASIINFIFTIKQYLNSRANIMSACHTYKISFSISTVNKLTSSSLQQIF